MDSSEHKLSMMDPSKKLFNLFSEKETFLDAVGICNVNIIDNI